MIRLHNSLPKLAASAMLSTRKAVDSNIFDLGDAFEEVRNDLQVCCIVSIMYKGTPPSTEAYRNPLRGLCIYPPKPCNIRHLNTKIEALIIRHYTIIIIRNPPNPILIVQAPTLNERSGVKANPKLQHLHSDPSKPPSALCSRKVALTMNNPKLEALNLEQQPKLLAVESPNRCSGPMLR